MGLSSRVADSHAIGEVRGLLLFALKIVFLCYLLKSYRELWLMSSLLLHGLGMFFLWRRFELLRSVIMSGVK